MGLLNMQCVIIIKINIHMYYAIFLCRCVEQCYKLMANGCVQADAHIHAHLRNCVKGRLARYSVKGGIMFEL